MNVLKEEIMNAIAEIKPTKPKICKEMVSYGFFGCDGSCTRTCSGDCGTGCSWGCGRTCSGDCILSAK